MLHLCYKELRLESIVNMRVIKIEAFYNNGYHLTEECGGIYKSDDIIVIPYENGEIKISCEKTELCFVKISFCYSLPENAVLLCDTWERGYGDLSWKSADYSRKMPWYFMAYDNKSTYCFGVKTQPNTFCYWEYKNGILELTIDTKNGSNGLALCGRILDACTVVNEVYTEDIYTAAEMFCKKMCDCPRLPNRPVYGGNDWYCNYGDTSFDKILTHAKRVAECSPKGGPKPYMVIDAGWQACPMSINAGPWNACNDNFRDMKKTAEAISTAGAIPGIWYRPLYTTENLPENHILHKCDDAVVLDPSVPEVSEKIRQDIKRLVEWGYRLIKHDFSTFDIFRLWGFEADGGMTRGEMNFADKTKTSAEIIKDFYSTLRETAGDDVMLMGCNTLSHLSAGIFEVQRTGDDTSGVDWERTKKYGINTLAFRMAQHNTFYCVDADCVGITKDIPWNVNKQWLDVLSKSGTALFVSISQDAYNDEIKSDITKAFKLSAENTEPSRPIDWIKSITPCVWKSKYGTDIYEW